MKKNLLVSILALFIFSAQAQITVVPCDSIDITVDPNSITLISHLFHLIGFKLVLITMEPYLHILLLPLYLGFRELLLSEDSAFTHTVSNMSPLGSYL